MSPRIQPKVPLWDSAKGGGPDTEEDGPTRGHSWEDFYGSPWREERSLGAHDHREDRAARLSWQLEPYRLLCWVV